MQMNLKLVTYCTDQEQFLVDVPEGLSEEGAAAHAVASAMRANKKIGNFSEEEWNKEMEDESMYKVEDVDLSMLYEIMKRNDMLFIDGDAIAFND